MDRQFLLMKMKRSIGRAAPKIQNITQDVHKIQKMRTGNNMQANHKTKLKKNNMLEIGYIIILKKLTNKRKM